MVCVDLSRSLCLSIPSSLTLVLSGSLSRRPTAFLIMFLIGVQAWSTAFFSPSPFLTLGRVHPRVKMLAQHVRPTAPIIYLQYNCNKYGRLSTSTPTSLSLRCIARPFLPSLPRASL